MPVLELIVCNLVLGFRDSPGCADAVTVQQTPGYHHVERSLFLVFSLS